MTKQQITLDNQRSVEDAAQTENVAQGLILRNHEDDSFLGGLCAPSSEMARVTGDNARLIEDVENKTGDDALAVRLSLSPLTP